jgi:hypothetical protein
VIPAGSVPVVIVTFPGAVPMVTARPFKVSFVVKLGVEPPVFPLSTQVSVTATISGAVTVTLLVTVLQFVGLETSQIV